MSKDTNTAYRLREHGLECAPIVDGRIDPKNWAIVDMDSLDEDTAKYLQGMKEAMIYATRID